MRVFTLAAVAMAAALAGYSARNQPEPREVRLDVTAAPTTDAASLAISPDGHQIAFVGLSDGQSRLWLRSLDTGTARPLSGTENASLPFWSPDGRSIGFTANGQLRRIDVQGGFAQTLTDAHGGGTWSRDGTILFDLGPGGDLFRIAATGGEPSRVTSLGPGNANDPKSPRFLPDDRHFLFSVAGSAPGIYAGDLGASGSLRRILDAQAAVFVPPGHLFFVRERRLLAQAFDVASLRLSGSPTTVAEQIVIGPQESSALAASASGAVVFRQGGSDPQSQFAWFDRSGRRLATIADSIPSDGFNSSMSPDGRWLAFSRLSETPKGRTADLWLLDLERGVPSRFTSDAMFDLTPVWAPDGRTLAFASNRPRSDGSSQAFDVYLKPVEGSGREEFVVGHAFGDPPSDWSADGRFILYNRGDEIQWQSDVWAVRVNGDRQPFAVAATEFNESNAQFSPDGKWIAYQSNESGRSEVYLQPFPGPGVRTRVSRDGGDQVRWRRDGKELFFLTLDDRLMAVPIQLGSDAGSTRVGTPVALFAAQLSGTPRHVYGRHYSVSPDGQRFLIDVRKEVTIPINVLLNWKPRE
jgi:Tol biopolymer transport system component